jgi:hypothetical protein
MRTWRGLSHRDELLRAFRIGPEDVAANHAGRLGPGQVRRMRRNIWFNVLAAALQAGVVALAVFDPRKSLFLYGFCAAVFAALLAMEFAWVRVIRRAIRAGVVQCLAGPVTVQSAGRGGSWLVVQGKRNRLWAGYWHVGRDRPYRVYIAPAAKLIVAMEPDGWE